MAQFEDIFDYQLDFLQDEVDTIQKNIIAYDNLSFIIKGWTITLWSVIIAYGSEERIIKVLLIGIPVIFVFWLLDALIKSYQRHFTFRMMVIEQFLNNQGEYKYKGIANAFNKHSFNDFPFHDIRGTLSKKQSPNLLEKFQNMTCLRNCFTGINISSLYFVLVILTIIISIISWN